MRIVDSIPHPVLKISVFSLDTRWTVKFEDGLAEITLKYSKEAFPNVEEVKALFDKGTLEQIQQHLQPIKAVVQEQMKKKWDTEEDEFPVII